MWEALYCEYFHVVKMVFWIELYSWNKIFAINGFTLPVFTYSFDVIHWRTTNLQQLDQWIRKLLSMHGVHSPVADVDWLYALRVCALGKEVEGYNILSQRISFSL